MRINNKRVEGLVRIYYIILLIAFIAGLVLYMIPIKTITDIMSPKSILGLTTVGFILLRLRGMQIFRYDSDGEALNFHNEDAFLSAYISSLKRTSDFPKYKLKDFKLKGNFIRSSLELILKSNRSEGGQLKLKYNISYLSKSEKNDLKKSLNKVVTFNKKNKTNKSIIDVEG
jgi:hypothetical protein